MGFRLLAQLEETENAFEQFWSKHRLKLEQCLQLRHFEQDFREVKMSLDGLLDGLVGLAGVGDCVARVERLLKELRSLEEKAQVGPDQMIDSSRGGKRLKPRPPSRPSPRSPRWKRRSCTPCRATS